MENIKKYAQWIEDGYSGIPCVCSYCGGEAVYLKESKEYHRAPRCPHCNAIMMTEYGYVEEDPVSTEDLMGLKYDNTYINADQAIIAFREEQSSSNTYSHYDRGYWNSFTMSIAILMKMKKKAHNGAHINADEAIRALRDEQSSIKKRTEYDDGYWNGFTMAAAILIGLKRKYEKA